MMATKKKVRSREELKKAIDIALSGQLDENELLALLAELRSPEPKKVTK